MGKRTGLLLLDKLKKNWILPGIAVACLWGYMYPEAGEYLGRRLGLLVASIMFLMGMGIGFRRFRSRIHAWKHIAVVMSFCYLAAPFLALLIAVSFFREQLPVYTGLILLGTTSTTLSTCIVFTRLAGGDEALALWLSVFSSLLCVLVSPVLIYCFIGAWIEVPVVAMMLRLLVVMFLPLAAGMSLRAFLGEHKVAPVGGLLTGSCTVIVLAVIMVSVAKGRDILGSSQSLPVILAVAVLHLTLILLVRLATEYLDFTKGKKIAVLFCSVQKTLQIPAYIAIEILDMPSAAIAPVLYHVFQLVIDSLLVSYFSSNPDYS
ncbi:MAG: bile acid:sodium symporter [Gemmatimonadota bacterium]|nr:bile acid:sodium symporter [Gemmatimonadota bacterium]